uniref:GDT1 family protein n=1 Tax=Glossina brevipalpis TaxID=37001 RepID=A0A1A9X2Q4_9MUSC
MRKLFRRVRQREEITKRKNNNKSYKETTEVPELTLYPSFITASSCQNCQKRDLLTNINNVSELKMNTGNANIHDNCIEGVFALNVITNDYHHNRHFHLEKAIFHSSPTLSNAEDDAGVYGSGSPRFKQQKLYASIDNNHDLVTLEHLTKADDGSHYRTNDKTATTIDSVSNMAVNSAAIACTCQDDLKESRGGGNNERLERDVTAALVQDPESGVVRKNVKKGAAYLTTRVLIQAFTMTFLAEWGDRSQLATIILAASKVS